MSQQAMSQYKEPAVGGQGCEVVETEGEPRDQGEHQGWHQQPAQESKKIRGRCHEIITRNFKLRNSKPAISTLIKRKLKYPHV
jgi:hypothetical protein